MKINEQQINKYVKEGSGIIGSIMNRGREKKPILVLVNGEPGSGKSYGTLRAIELYYEMSKIKKEIEDWHIIRSKRELDYALDNADIRTQLIIEEASVLFNSRRSQSNDNVGFTNILDIFRAKYIGLWLTFPIDKAIDTHARKLASHQIIFKKIHNHGDKENGFSTANIYKLSYNSSIDKIYRKHIKVKRNGRIVKVSKAWFSMPKNAGIIERYEELKMNFITTKIKNELAKSIEKEEKEKHKMKKNENKKATKKERNKEIIKLRSEGKTYRDISDEVGCSLSTIKIVLDKKKESSN